MITGPKIMMLAPESNNGRIHVHIDGEEQILIPGQSTQTFGCGIWSSARGPVTLAT